MLKKILMATGLVVLIGPQVNAQSLGFGPALGYQKARDADAGKFMGGVALRLKLTSALGAEASINYRHEKYSDGALTVRSWPVMVTGFLYPLPIVYAAIGAGWHNRTLDYDQSKFPLQIIDDETTQEFGWHFGAGMELPAGSKSRLTADIRYVFLDYDFEQVPGSEGLDSDFYVITAGFLFGL
jgi:opacity protein-like surface antigen